MAYDRIGETKESKSFSSRPQELSRPTVFFILKYAFLALSISISIASPKLPLYFSTIPRLNSSLLLFQEENYYKKNNLKMIFHWN
jgi:hypothetical protein